MIINLHLLDACNFNCVCCFARFGAKKTLPCNAWKIIVDNILDSTNVERFNLAGGEPLLYNHIAGLADYIRSKGSAVSIITNGYNLSEKKIDVLNNCGVSMIGLSIDSANAATLRQLGRCTTSGDILAPAKCIDLCRRIRKRGMSLKINSVISQLNCTEDFTSFIHDAQPNRWKILKVKEFKNNLNDNTPLLITDAQFNRFVQCHQSVPHVMERSLANAYIMVDAFGNLVDTGTNNNTPVANLLNTSFRDAFADMNFDYDIYHARYAA